MINIDISEWTPLHTRFISYRIGDGTVNSYGNPVWDNKHITEFVQLAKILDLKLWKPVKSHCGTYKIVMPKYPFEEFGKIFHKDIKALIENPVYLLESIKELPKEHRLQSILALITDDGSCKSWVLVVFEDQNKKTVEAAYELWNSIFPGTASIRYHKTKHGTVVYHIYANKKGIEQLYYEILRAENKYGPLANLWRKQKDLENRYSKIISPRAKILNETKEKEKSWKESILDYLNNNGTIKTSVAMKALGLSYYRTNGILYKMVKQGEIFLNSASSRSFYSLEPDKTLLDRERIILGYVKEKRSINNKEARKMLNRSESRTNKILKAMVKGGQLKQTGSRNGEYVPLSAS